MQATGKADQHAIKAFAKQPGRRWRLAAAALLAWLWLGGAAARAEDRDPVAQWALQQVARSGRVARLPKIGAKILVIPVGAPRGFDPTPLSGGQVRGIIEKLDEYSGAGTPEPIDGVVFVINATGGLNPNDLDAMVKLAEVLQIHDYPVVAWVDGTAQDEAAWLAFACDRIYAAPGSRFGGGPFDPLRDPAEEQDVAVMEFTANKAKFAANLAGVSGYNGDVAAAMTDARTVLYHVTIDGQPTVLTEASIAAVREKRPGATVAVGGVYKAKGARLRLKGPALFAIEIGLVTAAVDSREALWTNLGVTQVQTIEVQADALVGAAGRRSWRSLIQIMVVLAVVAVALFLVVCELWMEPRGYAFIAAAGLILSYLIWATFRTPLGAVGLILFAGAVATVTVELFRPTRRGWRGVAAFGAMGLSLGLTLVPEVPGLDPTWRMRHLPSEFGPAVGSLVLLLGGGTVCAAAVGLFTFLRLRHTARYRRRWRKRFENWDDSRFLALQAQIGLEGRTVVAITPPATAPLAAQGTRESSRPVHPLDAPAPRRPKLAAPDREGHDGRFESEGASVGEVEVAGRRYPATCTGSIAAGQPVVVVDCTEERLIVRHLPSSAAAVPPWQAHSKYEHDPAATKYAETESAAAAAARYAEMEARLQAEQLRYQGPAAEEQAKYPPKVDETKYAKERKVSGGSKYRPEDGAPAEEPKANE